MTTTYRFPALVWQDAAGYFSACLVELTERAAIGRSVKEAVEQLRNLMEWRYRNDEWLDPPDLDEAELMTLKVPIRPEYLDERTQRRYPLNEPFELRVPCVIGGQSSGMRLAALPLLGLRLNLHPHDDLKALVTHAVQRQLEGMTPRQLSRFVPPEGLRLEDVFVSVDRRRETQRPRIELEVLPKIADPLGDPKVRSQFGRAWERDREVDDLAARLRADRASLLLFGESGCGKTTIACEAIRRIERLMNDDDRADEEAWERKPARRFWQTSAGRLISGMKYLGQWEERLEEVIRELHEIDGVLCVESLLELVRVGGRDPTDSLAAFCIPYLQRGELRLLAEVSATELDSIRRLLPGLADLFQIVAIPTMSRPTAVNVLNRIAETATTNSKLEVASDVAASTVQLFARFQPYQALPGEAVPFLREVIEQVERHCNPKRQRGRTLQNAMNSESGEALALTDASGDDLAANHVTSTDVVQHFLRRTGLPELFLRDELALPRESLLSSFRQQIIGQGLACEAAADVVLKFKAGMNDPQRPLGVLLFCGPTGVGKTELAKTVGRCLFGAEARPTEISDFKFQISDHSEAQSKVETRKSKMPPRLLRLDMSEYSGPWAADRLLLQANGEPSDFVQQIRRTPFTVVLFDEIEKAHPDVCDVLMNVFDEGRLTDRFGRVTFFRSAVIVLTSNLGATISGQVGFGDSDSRAATARYEKAAREFFRPEFFNRLDSVVTFNPLSQTTIETITEKELREIAAREGLRKWNLRLTWSPDVVRHLARVGFDPRYGARPLQRTLEAEVVSPLSRHLLESGIRGPATISLTLSEDNRVIVPKDDRRMKSEPD